jgi:hypothetical protein
MNIFATSERILSTVQNQGSSETGASQSAMQMLKSTTDNTSLPALLLDSLLKLSGNPAQLARQQIASNSPLDVRA